MFSLWEETWDFVNSEIQTREGTTAPGQGKEQNWQDYRWKQEFLRQFKGSLKNWEKNITKVIAIISTPASIFLKVDLTKKELTVKDVEILSVVETLESERNWITRQRWQGK